MSFAAATRVSHRRFLSAVTSSTRGFSLSRSVKADPWPLPHSPEHMASTETPSDLPPPTPIPRINESVNTLRARLVYQSRKRGTLESDLLLSTFARDNLPVMSEQELQEYDRLLDEPDWDIYYWATGNRTAPERWRDTPLLQKLAKHAKNEGKTVRIMPALPA
ncbi:Flavinator of succinate dehydrogenase-domain-containing protein [Pterulicium gracile]|uniref:Succinate dehydrogenase assembly factor 2, mitochondrial n=1 Tax=Pterulicium gracile TaxID=1884261 RepID=A0A5C3QIS0_9AGAR|nr:Flavinator of succinate dehydrogenase-domain-containing protein [Pterula gracilis]